MHCNIPASRLSIFAVCFAFVAPTYAGVRKCASHTLTSIDARNVIRVAARALGSSRLIEKSISVCMNPGRATAWFRAEPESQPDESILNPSVNCERHTGAWRCEKLVQRTVRAEVKGERASQALEFRVPDEMPIQEARDLIAAAFDIAPRLEESQFCGFKPNDHWFARASDWLQDLRHSFAAPIADGWSSINKESSGAYDVDVSFNLIHFQREKDGAGWQFRCWDFEIVVT